MALVKLKPTSAGRRHYVKVVTRELHGHLPDPAETGKVTHEAVDAHARHAGAPAPRRTDAAGRG